mgnify:CR=1 FL=1
MLPFLKCVLAGCACILGRLLKATFCRVRVSIGSVAPTLTLGLRCGCSSWCPGWALIALAAGPLPPYARPPGVVTVFYPWAHFFSAQLLPLTFIGKGGGVDALRLSYGADAPNPNYLVLPGGRPCDTPVYPCMVHPLRTPCRHGVPLAILLVASPPTAQCLWV